MKRIKEKFAKHGCQKSVAMETSMMTKCYQVNFGKKSVYLVVIALTVSKLFKCKVGEGLKSPPSLDRLNIYLII